MFHEMPGMYRTRGEAAKSIALFIVAGAITAFAAYGALCMIDEVVQAIIKGARS